MRGQNQGGRSRSLQVFVIALVAVVAIGLVALNLPRRSAAPRADPSDASLVAQGQQVYQARCASCHGVKLEGQPNWQQELPGGGRPAPPHDASGHTWHHPDALLFDITKRGSQASMPDAGVTMMPGFGGVLSDAEIWAVIAYIKSQWPSEIQAAQAQVNTQAGAR